MNRVLIVDDEPLVLRLLQRLVDRLGYEARAADSGEQAVELLQHETFDVIVLDLRMPGMSGVEAWEIIREREGDTPAAVLITAAHDGPQLAREYGMAFLPKPFDSDSLRATLEQVLRDG